MNQYTLDYTGASVSQLLEKAEVAVITDECSYSTAQQSQARININAASKEIEDVTVPSLQNAIIANASDIYDLGSALTSANSSLSNLDTRTSNASRWDILLSQTSTSNDVPLEITPAQYANLASYIADYYDSSKTYIYGYFCKDSTQCYQCQASITTGDWKETDWMPLT